MWMTRIGLSRQDVGALAWLHFALVLALLLAAPANAESPPKGEDSCVACHRNPDFLVRSKKLYDYFRDWELSVHSQEGVTCSDCHGGNPRIADKKKAHGANVGEESPDSAVNFKNIPDTCGRCHDEFLAAYLDSDHFGNLVKAEQQHQGPNCVTCHGSMNTAVLDVATVKAACARCHNDETENNPEIPDEARVILNRFLSIDRFHRYVSVRLKLEERRSIFEVADPRIHALAVLWHTFDLEKIEQESRAVVELMQEKRDAVRKRNEEATRP
jgi:hypothetical protein